MPDGKHGIAASQFDFTYEKQSTPILSQAAPASIGKRPPRMEKLGYAQPYDFSSELFRILIRGWQPSLMYIEGPFVY